MRSSTPSSAFPYPTASLVLAVAVGLLLAPASAVRRAELLDTFETPDDGDPPAIDAARPPSIALAQKQAKDDREHSAVDAVSALVHKQAKDDSHSGSGISPVRVPMIELCKNKVTQWFLQDDWYTLMDHYQGGGGGFSSSAKYEGYVPCLVGKYAHVHKVLLHELSFFESGGSNEVKKYVFSIAECRVLRKDELTQAAEQSFDDMCPFPLKHEAYMPNLQPATACAYNATTTLIKLNNNSMCPEGHRCACDANDNVVEAVNPSTWTRSFGLQGLLDGLSRGYIGVLQQYAKWGTMAAAGMWVGTAYLGWTATVWALSASTGGSALVVYGYKSTSEWWSYSCRANVGCQPMDCAYEEGIGCRINLDIDDSDPRNPYWFMPPPLYKCGVGLQGTCKLSVCTAQEAKRQVVGEGIATYRGGWNFRKMNRSTVFNCQPTLAKDMEYATIRRFEDRVAPMRQTEHQMQRRAGILLDQLHRHCPFLKPLDIASQATCVDGTKCVLNDGSSSTCCVQHGGFRQCSQRFPHMCIDNSCDTEIGRCRNKGGMKECAAQDRCAFALPTLTNDLIECKTGGKSFPISHFETDQMLRQNRPWCFNEGGLKRCPWNLPMMCSDTSCNGEHCCAKDCTNHGGPKQCQELLIERTQSGARRSGQLLWPMFVALLSSVVFGRAHLAP